jgi:septum formation protein
MSPTLPPLVLASASPRRRELLAAAGFRFSVRPASIPELRRPGEPPGEYVLRLAAEKALAVPAAPEEIVLGADTTVTIGGDILEKPAGPEDALRMLRRLSGRQHQVLTGICLRRGSLLRRASALTRVWFLPIPEAEMEAYAASPEPLDKAGAYAIQGAASRWTERIDGCYFNVVGLPVSLVWRELQALA